MILAAVPDLLFRSRIQEVARHLGAQVQVVRDPESLLTQARLGPSLIVIDLEAMPVETVASIRVEFPKVRIVGFLSHVHRELREAALKAGCTEALARSEFTKRLPEILKP